MDQAVANVVEQLHKMSTKVTNKTETEQVATVASNFDTEVGKMIAEATEKVGKDGVITKSRKARPSRPKSSGSRGCSSTAGYLSPYFVTNPTTMEVAVLEDAFIPIHEKKDLDGQGPRPGPREGRPVGPSAPDHRRGDRRRGPGHAGHQ